MQANEQKYLNQAGISSRTARGIRLPINGLAAASIALCALPATAQTTAQVTAEATLPVVTVKDERDRETAGYQGEKTRIGKTPQLAKDIPQSVTIISEQLIRERNADTFKEALRNVAGLTFNAGEGGRIGDNITLRGYSAVGDLFLDGIRDIAQYNRDTFNYEQIEVLRGSASMLFGRGSTGGVINQVSKKAKPVDINEAALTVGSFQYKRLVADLNKVINDDLSFRLNFMNTDTGTFRNDVKQRRWGVAPTLTWGAGTSDEVNLSYFYLQENNIPDFGVPYFQGRPINVPIERYYGLANADYERNQTGIATATYTHLFSNDTALRTTLRKADYDRDLRATAPRLANSVNAATGACNAFTGTSFTDATLLCRQRQARGSAEHTWTLQSDYSTKLQAAGMKHEVLAGFEYLNEDASRFTNTSALVNPSTTVGNVNTMPVLPANFDASFQRTAYNFYKAHTASLYGQDTIEFLPTWKALFGARFDSMKADYDRPAPAGPLSRNDNVWSWRTGLMHQPSKTTTYYVSYGTSFNPSAELYQLDNRTANTPPEKSRNIEVGAKWELLNGDMSVRTALFRSEKTNERNTDVASPDIYLLSAKRHTDGIELEGVGRINAKWDVFSNVAFMNAKVDEGSSSAGSFGKIPINTPKYTYSLWTTYKPAPGWKVGGGLEGVGARWANSTNTNEVPSYQRVDALVEYAAKKYSLKLNVFNLLNKTYYEGVYAGHVLPGTPRALQLTLGTKF
ncbi:catecholate siderophore receptor [Noviherbaspirillum humi]|uniref:Catecholate siderophore receptor n=1 Tax=Noviherbaspirillum humi TaxID=1688639 RepID=A0A239J4Y5_9BURK|nr:TonB-dependent siderophore receptor [Noviherbaspirillum humi]SNT00742.1 catecholate siderophore receptor [Noviherbaspirillum humi]